MAQKINPISFRLGISQVWDSTLQLYGKSYLNYFLIFHKYLQIRNILNRIFLKNNLIIDFQEWKIYKNKISLNIYYSHLFNSKQINHLNCFNKVSKTILEWFSIISSIHFYLKAQKTSTTKILIAYTHYLLEQNISAKKIIWNLCKFLETNKKIEKISYFKFGIFKLHLKGFKIRLSGRFDNSKNQMSKNIEQTVGSLPLTCLKSSVEYINKEIYTKSGICGLQIWLFYEINY